VKDNNELLAGTGNTSNVSANEGVAVSPAGTAKKSNVHRPTGLFVYLKGQDFDLAKEVSRQPVEFGRKLTTIAGAVWKVNILKDSIRISCSTPRQKGTLMQVADWFGKPVTVSEPWSQAPAGNRSLAGNHRSTAHRGIIFGVSTEVSESDIKSETGANYLRRVLKWDSGKQIPTESVVLHYPDALPDFVSIGFLRFKVKPYIPQPIRCNKCLGNCHIAVNCRHQVRCVRCGKGHSLDVCPIKD